jgi:DNA polymerase III epsilon subunit family exonuclease
MAKARSAAPGARKITAPHLDEADFLIVDVETTGLSAAGGDRVCEIGAVKLRGGAVVDTFGSLIDPCRPVSSGAYAVNRISPQMLAGAPTFTGVAERLWAMMDGSVLVAYNAPFDLSFLEMEFRLLSYPPIRHNVVDALVIARQLLPGLGRYPQANVARVLGIASPVTHRALEDSMVTAQMFTMFLSMLKAYDCTSCADLHRKDLAGALQSKRTALIEEALGAKRRLWLRYLSPANAEITQQIVSPKEFVRSRFAPAGAGSLIAFCHESNAERQFQIDRILDLRALATPAV